MKTLNFNKEKTFSVGKTVVAYEQFSSGLTTIRVGSEGIIESITVRSFPDMNLFDLNILYMKFDQDSAIMSEQIAKKYFKVK